jgi:hypothetical protein
VSTNEQGQAETHVDFSQLVPANERTWSRVPHFRTYEAVALSLNIDPRDLADCRDTSDAEEAYGAVFDPNNAECGPQYLGPQQDEFHERSEELRRAISVNDVPTKTGSNGEPLIPVDAFVRFARSEGWSLPSWLGSRRHGVPRASKKKVGKDELQTKLIAFAKDMNSTWRRRSRLTASHIAVKFRELLTRQRGGSSSAQLAEKIPTLGHLRNILTDTKPEWSGNVVQVAR